MLESKNKVYQKILKTGQPIMDMEDIQENMTNLNTRFQVCILNIPAFRCYLNMMVVFTVRVVTGSQYMAYYILLNLHKVTILSGDLR